MGFKSPSLFLYPHVLPVKSYTKKTLAIVVLTILLFLLSLFEDHPQAVERFYSKGFYPVVCKIFHPVFNLIPFSVGDVGYAVVVIFLIVLFARFIILLFKKQFKRVI